MADITTILVAAFGAVATVTSGLGGYRLAGRNEQARDSRTARIEEARDIRAAQRENGARATAFAERLQEQRHEWQREVLLELQDAIQQLARATGKILHQDRLTVRERGAVFQLPERLGGDESLAATVAVQKLRSRILADDLRALVGDFIDFCGYASAEAIALHKDDPPEELAALINDLEAQMGRRYPYLMEQLGAHIRRELGRHP